MLEKTSPDGSVHSSWKTESLMHMNTETHSPSYFEPLVRSKIIHHNDGIDKSENTDYGH